jgi:membrane protease YdiL (CAAX protease family)
MNAKATKDQWLEWLLVFVLLLISFDVVVESDKPMLGFCLVFLGCTLYRRAWDLLPSALLLFFMFVGSRFYPEWVWKIPTAPFLIPLLLTWFTCLPFAHLRPGFNWLRIGNLDQITWFLVVLISLISALALILWALWTNYLGVATQMLGSLREVPLWFMLLVGIPGFALANALAEEAVFRGVLQDVLEKRFTNRLWLVIGVQASAFAAAHYQHGFPNGKIGYAMTFTYACMLGFLRKRTEGMLAPYVAHVTADAVIGITLVLLAG